MTVTGLGFGDIPSDDPNNPANPIPLGSNIEVQAHAHSLDNRKGDSNIEHCNSLFAGYGDPDDPKDMPSSPTDAHITNFRHLENLSKLDGSSAPITAKLDDNICWTSSNPSNPDDKPFKEGVQAIRDEYSIPSSPVAYTPVSLENTTFDGNGKTIKNLEIDQPDDNGNAGVFGTLTGDNTIKNVKLDNTSVTTTEATKAGALIGSSEGGTLTVSHTESHTNGDITATDYAGGLIGYASGDVSVIASASYSKDGADSNGDGRPGSVTATGRDGVSGVAGGLIGGLVDENNNPTPAKVEGCAAANVVTANGEDSVAGGLIGQTGGTVDVKLSYAGGAPTDDGSASVTGAYAGGLIGHSDGPDVTVEKSYSSATADGSKEENGLSTGDVDVKDPAVSYGSDRLKPHTEGSNLPTPGAPYSKDLLDENNPANTTYPYNANQELNP